MQVEEERIYQKAPFFFSVSRNCFAPNKELGKPLLQFVDEVLEAPKWYTNYQDKTEESEQSLESYPIILVGGRGLGSSQEAQKLEHLGELLGAGVGATRPREALAAGADGTDALFCMMLLSSKEPVQAEALEAYIQSKQGADFSCGDNLRLYQGLIACLKQFNGDRRAASAKRKSWSIMMD